MKTSLISSLLIILFLQSNLKSQGTQAFDFVSWPKSVSSFGMGEMGVASLTNDDALIYNPAKLSLTNRTWISFYRNPLTKYWASIPSTNITAYHKDEKAGSFALSYENRDHDGRFTSLYNEIFPGIYWEDNMHSSEGSVGAAYAKNLSENLSMGVQFRYVYWRSGESSADGYFFSIGGLYTPELIKGLSLGFSLMNLGPAVKLHTGYEGEPDYYFPPPAKLNLGINFAAVENGHFTIPLSLGISKPFDKRDNHFEGESSFKTLFTDWNDFPNDASLHTGLGFVWKPLFFSKDFGFFQEFYFGNYSRGIKSGLLNFYTHAFNFGLILGTSKISAGYAGISHNVLYPHYTYKIFPYETFQLTFGLNENLFSGNSSAGSPSLLKNLIISFGIAQTVGMGDLQIVIPPYKKYSINNNLNYSLEASFYIDERSALVSTFSYNSFPDRLEYEIYIDDAGGTDQVKIETFSLFSSYRYHPLDNFKNLFIHGGLGIVRFNQIFSNTNQYEYKSALQLAAGINLDFWDPLIITPFLAYNVILIPAEGDAPRMNGYNQLNFGLKLGYKIF